METGTILVTENCGKRIPSRRSEWREYDTSLENVLRVIIQWGNYSVSISGILMARNRGAGEAGAGAGAGASVRAPGRPSNQSGACTDGHVMGPWSNGRAGH